MTGNQRDASKDSHYIDTWSSNGTHIADSEQVDTYFPLSYGTLAAGWDPGKARVRQIVLDSWAEIGGDMEIRTLANVDLVKVQGRIDHISAPVFESELLPQVAKCSGEEKKLLLDCSELTYLSSAGLRVLMIAAKRCRQQNGKIVLAVLQPTIQEIFRISRFDTVFEVFSSVPAALAAISPAAAAAYERQ
jgi:anti-anti-sigma factor